MVFLCPRFREAEDVVFVQANEGGPWLLFYCWLFERRRLPEGFQLLQRRTLTKITRKCIYEMRPFGGL
jgi:hypothetical protein